MERSGNLRPPSRWPLQPHNDLVPTGMAALSPVHALFIPSGRASTSCSGQDCADAIESAGGGTGRRLPPLPRCYSNHDPPEGQDQ
jgi:hypothetical protein